MEQGLQEAVCVCVCVCVRVCTQLCPTLCDPMDCSLSGMSICVHPDPHSSGI